MSDELKKILLVGESQSTGTVFKQLLHNSHCVFQAENAHEALRVLQNHPDIHLVLSDIGDRDDNGLETLTLCHETYPDLPVVCLTSKASENLLIRALRSGAYDFLTEPFREEEVVHVVQRVEQVVQANQKNAQLHKLVKELRLRFEVASADLMLDDLQKIVQQKLMNYTSLSRREILNLMIVFEESVTNAHEHGNLELQSCWKEEFIDRDYTTKFDRIKEERLRNPHYGNRRLRITVTITHTKVTFTVEDEGAGFRIQDARVSEGLKPYGMGLTIIRNLADEMHFNRKGNRITVLKYLA